MSKPLVWISAALAFACMAFELRADDPKEIVRKAIEAAGIPKTTGDKCSTWKDEGTMRLEGQRLNYRAEWAFQKPDRYRFVMHGDFGGQEVVVTVAVKGDEMWESAFGMTRAIEGPKFEYVKNEVYMMNIYDLVPLVADGQFNLKSIPDEAVSGKPAAGVQIDRKDRPTVKLYFDRESGLLVKSSSMVKDEFQNWKEVPEEVYFEDYQTVGGRRLYGKLRVVREGKPLIETRITEQKFPETLDDKLFDKP